MGHNYDHISFPDLYCTKTKLNRGAPNDAVDF